MRTFSGLTVAVVLALLLAHQASAFPRTKRQAQLHEDDSLTPDNEALNPNEEADRGKRFLEPVIEVGGKAKNAILGLVFGPTSPTPSPLKRISRQRQSGTTDNIPVFDRDQVRLDFPPAQFGGAVSLLMKSTKVIGSVIENSAQRYQTFLRLFRPFFRGVFAIKGLDPVTPAPKKASLKSTTKRSTTTTTTEEPEVTIPVVRSSTSEGPVIVDLLQSIQNNEVRRR